MAKKLYVYQGKEYATMLALAAEVGVKRIYPKDFERLGVTVVTEETKQTKSVTEVKQEVTEVEPVAEVKQDEPVVETKQIEPATEVKQPEPSADFIVFCESLKGMELDTLKKFAECTLGKAAFSSLNVGSLEPRICRMKLTMALKAHQFPGQKLPKTSPSEFSNCPFELMLQYVEANNISYIKTANANVNRMRVTQALLQAGVKLADIQGDK